MDRQFQVAIALFVLLVSSAEVSHGQSCGSTQCSQDYHSSCSPDESCQLYDNCMTSQSDCNEAIGEPANKTVVCYDTCIEGNPIDPTIPAQCCADPIVVADTASTTVGNNFVTVRLYSPNEEGMDIYRHNTFCKYNVECPSDAYDLHYFMVDFDIEPPDGDTCLDFLRFYFTATGTPVEEDACGELADLSASLKSGAHGHKLALDFRSNRIHRTSDFFLSVVCITSSGARRRRQATDTQLTGEVIAAPKYECTPSKSLTNEIVRDPYNEPTPEDYLSAVFPTEQPQIDIRRITIPRTGAVTYKDKTITVLEEGKTLHSFRNIDVLRVNNRIEGDLMFTGSTEPQDRLFPGYGYIQVGKGSAEYVQTLVEPNLLLNDKEEIIVRELYRELFNRQTFDDERFYLARPEFRQAARVNCSVNELAELNSRSCTPPLRAAATFFLDKDTFVDFCKKEADAFKQV